MAKREKNPASDKTGNDTGISLLVRKRNDLSGTAMAKAGKVLSIAGICIAVVNWILAIVLTFMTLA